MRRLIFSAGLLALAAYGQEEGLNLCPNQEQLSGAAGASDQFSPPAIVGLLASKVGLNLADFRLVPLPTIGDNAYAQYCPVLRWNAIFYNPSFVPSTPSSSDEAWFARFVFAHEVGHHMKGHFTTKRLDPWPDREAEADEWAGWAMCRIGAPIDKILAAIDRLNPSEAATAHYYGRCHRRMDALRGYNNAASADGKPTYEACLDCYVAASNGLFLTRSVQAGDRFTPGLVQACGKGAPDADRPLSFPDHLAGGCVAADLSRGTLLRWDHVRLCGQPR